LRKFFVKNIFFLLLVNLIVKPVWIFAIDRNVQNSVGHEVYGQYQALLSFSIIFQVLLDFGLQSYNSRTVSQSPRIMKTLFPNIVLAKGLLSIVYFVLIMALGLLIGYRGHALFLLFTLSLVQILNSFLLYLRSNVSAMHHFKTDSLLSVSDRLFMIVVCGFLLFFSPWKAEFKIEWFIYAQIASYVVTGAIAFFICMKMTTLNWGHFHLLKVWVICKSSFPYALLIFLMAVYLRADAIIIERVLPDGKEEAGVFAAGFRLLDVANNVSGVLFAGILLPLFGRLLAKREAVYPIVRVSIVLLLPFAFTVMLTAWFFGADIMKMLYVEATDYDGKVFSVLMSAFPGFCIGYVYATLLTANGNLKQLILLSLMAVIFNLTLNFILIPKYGALGAAISAVLTQLILAVFNIKIAQKLIHLKPDGKWLLQYAVFIALMFAACWLLHGEPLKLYLQLLIIAATGLLLMLLCGFVPFGKIKELMLHRQ
jgi:O-antigen/teichoic acid export membrane protein